MLMQASIQQMGTDMSSFGTPPMGVGAAMGMGPQMQGPNMAPIGSLGGSQMQGFGPGGEFVQSQGGRSPYMYGESGGYPGMQSQFPLGQSQVRRFGYGMMPGVMGPPLGMVGPAMVGPPVIGPPVVGPPMMGGGYYDPYLW